MEICFDNSCRLARERYLFRYGGVTFKLVQENPRKWADHLLTIVPDHESPEAEAAYAAGCEFISALGWEHQASVAVGGTGGGGWPDDDPLRLAQPRVRIFPRVPFRGNTVGCDLHRLPYVQTNEQRMALALYREAGAANSSYLQFLFYWQVMEVGRGADAPGFVTSTWRKDRARLHLRESDINELPLAGRPLSAYLLDDCRDAIAHIRRKPGRAKLDLDVREERRRLERSTWVVKAFAEHYIRTRLNLTKYVWLMRPRRGGVPSFMDDAAMMAVAGGVKRAYPAPRLRLFRTPSSRRRR
jgi:hypothetical protein